MTLAFIDFVTGILNASLSELPVVRHEDFLLALRCSLEIDPYTYSPEVFEPFGFSQRELYDLRVLLLRPLAQGMMSTLGYELSGSQFDKRSTYNSYERCFGRQPWLISVRPRIMLLTFTEWSVLIYGKVIAFPLPEPLQRTSPTDNQ